MNNITTELFFKNWLLSVNENREILINNWRNSKNFTFSIRGEIDSVLSKVATNLNLKVYENDYYSLDAIFYDEKDLCPRINSNSHWFRNIRIAFEHENNFYSGLYQEISHLIITNCELKVLVTYPNDEEEGFEELKYFSEIIQGNRKEKEFSDNEEILVIFGYENDFQWEGYIYKTNEWKKL